MKNNLVVFKTYRMVFRIVLACVLPTAFDLSCTVSSLSTLCIVSIEVLIGKYLIVLKYDLVRLSSTI
ncbi:hypothetical protein BpHYR1_049781 [Brachionus plicatilis]|uniref:Uncharacterized protein n=1 Tax=Brachionus plicatilis TaxID=10195 RepID=A0A3M7PKG5_BRAPC|nr:hypothetical protein BpHYR1_049781 [Brachionus plicatilis]